MPKIKYRDLASALRQDLGQDVANIDDVSLVQAWITDNPQYKNDVIFDGQVGRIAKRTGNLLEDLKTAEPLPRTTVAPQRGRSGFEAPMQTPFTGGFVGGEMAAPQRPAEDIEFLPTTYSNTLEGQRILDFTKGKKDVESIRDYFTSVAQEGAVGSESKLAKASALRNALDVNSRFAEEQYNDLYPDAPLSWSDFMAKYSDPQLQQDREILGQELTSLFGKMKYYEAMGDEQSYNQAKQSADEIANQYDSLFGEFEQVLQVASPLLEQVNQYGQELNQLNDEANKEAQDIEETSFFGKAALSLSRFGAGLGYVAADLFSTLGATGIGDKMKSGLMDSQLSTKDPRMAAFKAPYDSKKGGFTGGVGNAVGFIFEQGLNMIPAIAAFSTPYGRAAQTALATIGTTATTYDEYANEIDRAAIETGAKIDPQTRAALAGMASLKTGLIENVIPINKFIKLGMAKSFADDAVRALASGKSLEVAMRGAYQASKAFAAAQGVEISEEIIDQLAQETINESVRSQMAGLEQSEQFAARPAEFSDYKDIVVNTAIAVAPLAGVGFISNGARFKEDLYHHVGRKGDLDAVMDLFEENRDKFKGESYKKNTDRLKKVSSVYESIPQEFDDINARKVADNMLEIDRLDGQINNRTSSSQREAAEKKIANLQGEIDQIYREEQEKVAPTTPQAVTEEVTTELEAQMPESDQNVLNVVSERIEPILNPLTQRMTNAEEIDMAEIEAVAEQMIDEQARILESENLSEEDKQSISQLIELQIDNILSYEFATITTTEQAGEKTKTAGLVATPREGRPLPESVVSRDRFDGAGVRVGGRGAGRIIVKRIPGFGGRSVYGVSFGNRKGVTPVEDLEFDNLEFVAPEVLGDGSLNVRVRDSKSGLEFTITDPELSMDLAIAAQLKEAGRKEFPQPAFLEAVREVTQGQPTQVTTFPNLGRTGTTPAAVGVEPQTEQDVRQETNAPQEGRGQGEDAAPVPQEEGRQEGQVTPLDVAQEGETPPATKRVRKTEQQKADEGKAALDKLKETIRTLRAKPGGGANIDLTFGVVPISKAVWNTALDTAILAIDAGQSIAQVIKDASDYISSKIDGDWGRAKFEQYMEERFGQIAPTQQQAKAPIESGDNVGLSRRLSGNALLNAQDLLDELSNNGADIDEDGNVTVYHRTSSEKKRQIEESGKMTGLENGLFFSTRETGQAEGYGNAIVKLKVPVEKLQIDDVFGNEAHVRIPTSRAGQKIDVLSYLKPSETQQQAQPKAQVDATAKALEGLDISPKNSRDLYRVNRELFGLNQSEAMSATIAMDKMTNVMAKRAGVSKTEMYGRLNFKKATEGFAKDLSNRGKLLFQLIGENAELSQEVRNNLQTARVMEAAGESVKSIRLRTGWERGKDDKWRYEINDSSVSLMFNMKSMNQLGKKYNLDSVLNYPELFSEYPELRKVKISISKKGGSTNEAFFDGNQIVLGVSTYELSSYIEKLQRQELLRNVPAEILNVANADLEAEKLFNELRKQGFSFDEALEAKMKKSPFNKEVDKMLLESGYGEKSNLFGIEFIGPNQKFFDVLRAIENARKEESRPSVFNLDLNKDLLLTTLHEIQHWIQKKEGFARGGNMILAYEQLSASEKSIYDDLQKKSKEKLDELDGQSLNWYDQGDDVRDIVLAPRNFLNKAYRKIAGEVEARNVEKRFGMTPEQRRATTLQETEDVARDEQMVLFEEAVPQGVKFQVDAWHGSPYQFDKFTTEKIGTGEGAQAFGWGLYFTDLEDIARSYAKSLAKKKQSYLYKGNVVFGDGMYKAKPNESLEYDIAAQLISEGGTVSEFSFNKSKDRLINYFRNEDNFEAIDKLNSIKFSDFSTETPSRQAYRVSIQKGKTPDQYTWLEWDKTVGEENAKKILAQLKKNGLLEKAEANWSRKNMGGSFSGKESLENDLKNLRGDHLYERFLSPRVTPVADGLGTSAINRLFGSAKDASLFLLSSGIDGVKYPAESIARGATSDTAKGFNYVVFDENAVSIEEVIKFQKDAVKARGAMMITLDGQATIYALTDPNVSTPLHELAHVFEHYLTDEERTTVQEWAKTKDWTIKTSEAFARGFEKYLSEGQAPTPALQKIFDNFKQWLTDIYRGIVGSDIDIELNKPMRDLYAKMFEFTGEDGPSNFEKWKGDNKLLVGPDIQDAKTGEPIVVRAYHGTTNEFYEFDSSVKGSVEGHLGKINYFTSDYQDAAINYLSEGPDLTSRVERRTDQIESELEGNYDDYYESIPKLSKKYGYTKEELQDDFVSFRSLARDLAKKELYGGTNKVLDVFIKLNNPVVLGKGSTWFQTLNISETDLDQAAQEIADENDISVEEAKQDYDFDIRDRAIENAGYENLAVDALDSALRSNGYRGASASEILGDNLYESDIDLNRLEKKLRQNDKAGLFENEEGELASSQVVSDFLKNLGFDGIILTNVSDRFRGMGLGSSTSHIHVFDEFANQIKLADGSNTTFGETRDIRFQLDEGKPQQQAKPEAKPEKTISEQRKEFRETAKKYFDGLKKMGIAFDPERNSKEDIAFLKALAKYIKLELDAGMVTFKGFMEKTANLIEGFGEKAIVAAAKEAWAKEVVKAYPKVYSKLQKAKKVLLDKELQDARATLQGNLTKLLSDQKIFKQISSLTTERKLDKSSSDILIGIREEIKALGGVKKLSDEQLLSYNEIAKQTYKDGRINQGQLIESLAAQKAADEKAAKSAITNQNERSVVEFKDANEAREFLSQNNGNNSNQVSINNGEIIVDSVEEFDVLSSMFDKRTTFGGTTTAPNPNNVKRGKGSFYRTTVGGGLIYLLDKLKGKTPSRETIDFFNKLQDEVKAGTFRKKRLNAELNDTRKSFIGFLFKNRLAYTRYMLSAPMINGKRLIVKDENGKEIKNLNVNNILFFYQLMKDPHFLKKDGKGERKIGLSEQSMRDIVDFVNLKENNDARELMNNDQRLIKMAAQNAANVMEANNISSELLTPRTLDLSNYENDEFIGEILNKIYNNSVPSEIEYFPSSVESEMNNQVPNVDALLDEGLSTNAVSAMSRFMIERVSGGKVKVKSYDAQLGEYIDSMSNTAAKLPILKRFQAVFNKENSNLISSYFGKNTTDELRENIGRYITSRQQDVGLGGWLIKKTSEGALGKWLNLGLGLQMFFNFATAFSQLASFPGPILSYGITNYLDGLSMLISGKADLRDAFISLKSGYLLQERLGSRLDAAAIVKSIPSDERGFYAYVNQFNKALISLGAAPSAYFDAASIMLSLPIYAREYENARKTMTEKDAKDYAEEKTMDLAESFLQTKNEEMMSSAESRYRTTLYSFATIVPQLHRQAIMAVKRIQRGEGDLMQNINIFVWSAIGSSVAFRLLRPFAESLFEGDDEDEELKKLRGDKRVRRVALDLAVDATKSFGFYGAVGSVILKTGYQLVEAEKDASKVRLALDIVPEVVESVPSVSIKLRNISDAIRSYYDDENLKGTTQGIQALTGLPTERSRMFAVQMSDGFLSDSFTMMERVTRLSGFISENKSREKLFKKAISTDPLLREKLSPSEIQKFESKQKSEYKSATSVIARQYSDATTESERDAAIARLISLQAGATKYDKAEELVRQIQDDFDKKVYENALPKEFLEIKKMPSTKRVNFVANEINAIKDEQEAMDYLETLSNFSIISENEKSEIVDILLKSNKEK